MEPITAEKFEELFEQLFTAHDKNGNGALEKDEALAMMQVINSKRPDGKEFDAAKFEEVWAAKSTDGKIAKAAAHDMLFKRAQTLGFIAQ